MNNRKIYWIFLVLFVGLMGGCDTPDSDLSVLVDPSQLPSTERGVLAADNRFFIDAGNGIYELLSQSNGARTTQLVTQRSDCQFSGLAAAGSKLYAACTASGTAINLGGQTFAMPAWSDLVRIDLARPASDPKRISTTRLGDEKLFPNGMAVNDKGDIYITNTFGLLFRMLNLFSSEVIPAIVRVRVTGESPFAIEKTSVLPAVQGGMEPNGIQIRGDRLWFVSMNVLYEAQIVSSGLRNLKKIYEADSKRVFDDFAVLPGNVLAIAEIPTPISLLAIFFPNTWPPSNAPSQLTFIATGSGPYSSCAGQMVGRYVLKGDITPSSATAVTDAYGPALYVTDFFFGGLYRVALD
ncbi:MAG: hypothetical protein M0036_06780 [Desulfobacteraceae bacterium]|nr:hypothetical protein [Desulfobacteraceae bacterium]